jgi:RNA polymerase sigma factor (sigma-70 family)
MTASGSPAEFEAFYRAHYSVILATLNRRLSDYGTAEDVASEVFRIAWSHHQEGGQLGLAWLYTVARNLVGNEYRRAARSTALRLKAQSNVADAAEEPHDTGADTRRAMMKLREADREILFMAYWEDLSGSEIAEILGCKVPTVWVRLNRARAALRTHLATPLTGAVDMLRDGGASVHG